MVTALIISLGHLGKNEGWVPQLHPAVIVLQKPSLQKRRLFGVGKVEKK